MQWEWTQSFARTRGRLRALDTKLQNSHAASTPLSRELQSCLPVRDGDVTLYPPADSLPSYSPDVATPSSTPGDRALRRADGTPTAVEPSAAGAARPVRRQRDRGARLRGGLVPAAG